MAITIVTYLPLKVMPWNESHQNSRVVLRTGKAQIVKVIEAPDLLKNRFWSLVQKGDEVAKTIQMPPRVVADDAEFEKQYLASVKFWKLSLNPSSSGMAFFVSCGVV